MNALPSSNGIIAMSENKEWDRILNNICQYLDGPHGPIGRFAIKLYDALVAKIERRPSPHEATDEKANFVWKLGVGLYERKRIADAIEVIMTAAGLYESVPGKERNEGLYKCYGYINYCYIEMNDIENALLWQNKTLEIEKLVRGYRDNALSSELLEGRNADFRWRT
ncbi:MAG: hypothetical protein K0M40_03865 [Prolixibacteraceae bacterium]|nr:hypothetical protein [Prolixibacteraceae bacterium]